MTEMVGGGQEGVRGYSEGGGRAVGRTVAGRRGCVKQDLDRQ